MAIKQFSTVLLTTPGTSFNKDSERKVTRMRLSTLNPFLSQLLKKHKSQHLAPDMMLNFSSSLDKHDVDMWLRLFVTKIKKLK